MSVFRLKSVLALILASSACGGRESLTAPSPTTTSNPSAPTPAPGAAGRVTFTVRSGAEGLPPVAGAVIHVAGRSATTNGQGIGVVGEMLQTDVYEVAAQGFLSYRDVPAADTVIVTLWPSSGLPLRWISLTSYYGPDYESSLWRPAGDIDLDLQGMLEDEPYRSVWEVAVQQVASAMESAGTTAPTVRLSSGPGAVPVRLESSAACQAINWGLKAFTLTPPPRMVFSSEFRARDPETVLDVVARLVGFNLSLGRREDLPYAGGTLSPDERTALRMRMLRRPGTVLFNSPAEDAVASPIAGFSSGYWCR